MSRVYQPRGPWEGPQHEREETLGAESPLNPVFFWSVYGGPIVKRTPPGSFPADPTYVPRHSVDVVMPPADDATVVTATWAPVVVAHPHEGVLYESAVANGAAVRCPACRWVSFHGDDIRTGWCGNCSEFTSDPGTPATGWSAGGATRGHLQLVGYDYQREEPA